VDSVKNTFFHRFCVLLSIICLLSSCSSGNVPDADEQAFIDTVAAITPKVKSFPVLYETLHDMIDGSHCDIIVRGTLTSRGECFEYPSDSSFIVTPYTVKVEECYLGDIEKGEVLTLEAPYGFVNGRYFLKSPYPILVTGSEYILFIRREEISDRESYVLAYAPTGALRITGSEFVCDTGFEVFGGMYNGSLEALVGDIRAAFEQ